MTLPDYALHRLGWKAFQDLCVAIVEERLQRPVQTFLPSHDSGRDGAFLGRWDGNGSAESTIQCKFTSKENFNLTLSMLAVELPKAALLAKKGLADDYIILTNHPITGNSELQIRDAFQSAGVGRCRVFHRDWIINRIHNSGRLRMMVPRLYGLVDLGSVLDIRAYQQAQLILSEMGDNLQKLVVTDAHRKSVRAVSQYNLVLLLGAPAAGKSTIGASLALGASDIWKCSTIKSTSPEHVEDHIDPKGGQFFWIDDAWGSTQFQRDRTEHWNQVFPLMQGAMKRGSRFLITSRDYIWNEARSELKLQSLPVLTKSQVIINVHELTAEEKARILYNHLKLGDQADNFRTSVKLFLPALAKRDDFLPESARRLGTSIFTESLTKNEAGLADFFARPKVFLEQTIENLAPDCKAAIALIFLNGGKVRSPVQSVLLEQPAHAFGVSPARLRAQLEALNQSLLNKAEDDEGPFWTYRHPTVSDAFASLVAKSAELIEIYLRGARPESIVSEVVCAGKNVRGAEVIVPNSLHDLLADRIASLSGSHLASFISFRSNKLFTEQLMSLRPDLWKRIDTLGRPLKEDIDVDLLCTLYRENLLSEERREKFVEEVRAAAIEELDDSFIDYAPVTEILTAGEYESILDEVADVLVDSLPQHVARLRGGWDRDYDPETYFDTLRGSLNHFAQALSGRYDPDSKFAEWDAFIRTAIDQMRDRYTPPSTSDTPLQQSAAKEDSLDELFRDVDE